MDIIYSDGLNKFFNDMNKASIDAWKIAQNVEMDYVMDLKTFYDCYGYNRPLEVFCNMTYSEAFDKRDAFFKERQNKIILKKKISNLLDEYDREDILKALKEVSEG